MKIIGLGNALVDVLIRLENEKILSTYTLPKGSMTLVDRDMSNLLQAESEGLEKNMASGGSAANTIHGLANLGVETSYVGKIGRDELGKFFESDMIKAGIRPFLYHSSTDTGRVMAFISPDSERTMATYLGAAVELVESDITEEVFEGYDYLCIEGYLISNLPLFSKAIHIARNMDLKIAVDLASYNIVEQYREILMQEVLHFVDIVFANEEEAKALTGLGPEEAVNEIARMCEIAVVKTGEKGSLVKQGENLVHIPARKVKSIDTTGAGDCYAAGFLYGLTRSLGLEKSGQIGTLLASHIIQVVGPKLDKRTWKLVKEELLPYEGNA
jgi:sugar/nucleoside kinase (ribokinase family)